VEELLGELTAPFDRLDGARVTALLAQRWGIRAESPERLDTERDDTYRAGDHVLKVAHPLDSAGLIRFQVDAMTAAARAGLPVQRVVPALGGDPVVVVDGRPARVLTWLRGRLLRHSGFGLPEVEKAGRMLARLARALRDVDSPAAHRTFAWDLQSFGRLEHGYDVRLPELSGLPHQVIHNDFHPGNLLVDGASEDFVTGILDFGDAVYAPRVQDLAVALAYLVPESGDPEPTVTAFVRGYGDLTPAELDVLPRLIAARLVQRIVLVPRLDPATDPAFVARLVRTLDNLTGRL